MSLENVHISKCLLTDQVYVGYVNKNGQTWRTKVDRTNEFIRAVIDRWNGYEEIITSSSGKRYKITVRELKDGV